MLKVWAIADSKRQGYLGFTEFITAMQVGSIIFPVSYLVAMLILLVYILLQLVSLAQSGHELTPDILKNTGK